MRRSGITGLMLAAFVLIPTLVSATPADALTTGHSGSGRPALADSGGRLYLGWTGSTSYPTGYELDLGWSTDAGKTITKIAQSERVPLGEGPALSGDGSGVYVAWAAANNADTLTASYFDGTSLSCRTAFTGVVTPHAPAMVTDPSGTRYLAWTDAAGHLNVAHLDSSACATTHTMALTDRVTLTDTSSAGPALVYDSSGSSNLGVLIAWTGTDAGHTVTVATYTGSATLSGRSVVTAPVGASGAPGLAVAVSDLYLGFVGTDGTIYFGYSEGCIPTCFHPVATSEQSVSGYGLSNDSNTFTSGFFDQSAHLTIDVF
jgi:hypothetical protein